MAELRSVTDDNVWWTIRQAADHLDVTPATIRRYIREGLPQRFGLVNRDELLDEFRRRLLAQRATRAK